MISYSSLLELCGSLFLKEGPDFIEIFVGHGFFATYPLVLVVLKHFLEKVEGVIVYHVLVFIINE